MVEREGVIVHDLESLNITSQDSMPVQSTPDGDSIDLLHHNWLNPMRVGTNLSRKY